LLLVNSFLIGADPEYIALDKAGTLINVGQYTTKDAPDVALDHNGDVLEIKPKPSKSTFRLLRRMQKLLLIHKISKDLIGAGYRLRGGAHYKTPKRMITLGGHIHFDIPCGTNQFKNQSIPMEYLSKDNQERVKALDALTILLEDLDILPREDCLHRRRYGQLDYGKLSAVRGADVDNHFEYRSMCSWLYSPISTMICLTAAKIVSVYPKSMLELANPDKSITLRNLFERVKDKDIDAARVIEKIFEPKLKLEAKVDKDIQDTWKSLKKLGGVEGELSTAL